MQGFNSNLLSRGVIQGDSCLENWSSWITQQFDWGLILIEVNHVLECVRIDFYDLHARNIWIFQGHVSSTVISQEGSKLLRFTLIKLNTYSIHHILKVFGYWQFFAHWFLLLIFCLEEKLAVHTVPEFRD